MSYKRFGRHVGLITVAILFVRLKGIILLPIISKTLGPQGYGTWVQITVIIDLLLAISLLGLTRAMTRFLASETDQEKIQEGFFSTVGFVFLTNSVVLLLFIYLLQPLLAPLWGCEKALYILEHSAKC